VLAVNLATHLVDVDLCQSNLVLIRDEFPCIGRSWSVKNLSFFSLSSEKDCL